MPKTHKDPKVEFPVQDAPGALGGPNHVVVYFQSSLEAENFAVHVALAHVVSPDSSPQELYAAAHQMSAIKLSKDDGKMVNEIVPKPGVKGSASGSSAKSRRPRR